jgi:hypothetical protein
MNNRPNREGDQNTLKTEEVLEFEIICKLLVLAIPAILLVLIVFPRFFFMAIVESTCTSGGSFTYDENKAYYSPNGSDRPIINQYIVKYLEVLEQRKGGKENSSFCSEISSISLELSDIFRALNTGDEEIIIMFFERNRILLKEG